MSRREKWIGLSLAMLMQAPSLVMHATETPQVGQRGVATAAPPVPRPPGTPCVVQLFRGVRFDAHGDPTAMSAHPERWSYAPGCPGPWAAVVLDADFSVTAGRQYDRTASLWLDGVNLFYGTTQEPGAQMAPSWHVERDLTDYAPLFLHAGTGQTILNNWVDAHYTGVIRGSARLLFYPAAPGMPQPADAVYGLDGDADGAPYAVQDAKQALARTLMLPRNVERAYLDIIAQSQATDEQWYMCIDDADLGPSRAYSLGPPASGDPLEQCGNGNYREVAVSIDGQPAGRAPVYPWTYTGGVDPNLWRPVPDLQTLNFVPYRLDLTPFAGVLDDGRPHMLAVRVLGAHHFFALAANLLVYADHGRAVLHGRITQNTLTDGQTALQPTVTRHWNRLGADATRGEANTRQQGSYSITGILQTSHGDVTTTVTQQATYRNAQSFLHPNAVTYHQTIRMLVDTRGTVRTRTPDGTATQERTFRYPLVVDVMKHVQPDGSFSAAIGMQQGYDRQTRNLGAAPSWSKLHEERDAFDTADFSAEGTSIRNARDQHGFVLYSFQNSAGNCYTRRIEVAKEAVSRVIDGAGCAGGVNHWAWHP